MINQLVSLVGDVSHVTQQAPQTFPQLVTLFNLYPFSIARAV